MSQVIEAVFENGVFRPLRPVEMAEREVVAIKIISPGEWQSKFSNVISRIHKNTARRRSEEIEADILSAVKEVRKEKYDVRVIIIGYRSSLVCQIRST